MVSDVGSHRLCRQCYLGIFHRELEVVVEARIGAYDERTRLRLVEGREGVVKFCFGACVQFIEL